jgi:CubicO group peptidase (beta-lactamase class C family)
MSGDASLLSAQIDAFVDRVRAHWSVPGVAVAALRGAGPVHVRAYGILDVESGAPADIDSAFAIGSCSKAFTAALAATLVDRGELGWDDPIRKFLGAFQLYDPWVSDHATLRDLLAHRTGLSRASVGEYGSDLSRAEILNHARSIQPIAAFRDQFTYCNVGFLAAAEAMTVAAGQPFETLMAQRLFAPLGLKASTVADQPWAMRRNMAAPHYKTDGKVIRVPPMALANLVGVGSQAMSAQDAARWLQFHLTEAAPDGTEPVSKLELRETHLLQAMRRDRTWFEGYGLGWDVRRRFIHHEGAIRGFRAIAWCDLEQGSAVFVATNIGCGSAHFAVAGQLHQLLRDEPVKDWIAHFDEIERQAQDERRTRFEKERAAEPVSRSRWSLAAFAGTYRHNGFGTLRIAPKADFLWFHIDGLSGFDGPLMRYSGLGFEYQGDRDAMAWPGIATPTTPKGDFARVRFLAGDKQIMGLDWFDWFGEARFVRDR